MKTGLAVGISLIAVNVPLVSISPVSALYLEIVVLSLSTSLSYSLKW